MNKRLVFNTLGKVLLLEALFLIVPLIVSIYYQEGKTNYLAFLYTIAILILVGIFLINIKPTDTTYSTKDGLALASFTWILMSSFGSLPFIFSEEIPRFTDALFETASGFTTTGASILLDVESMSNSMLFWRSFTHFIGGMGILVFALAVMPKTSKGSVHVMKAEVPGPVFGKLVSKVDISAKILYKIYIVMTIGLILILIIAGMGPFDAMINAFGAAGTGGFSNNANSIAYYNNATFDYILGIAMLIFGVNFNLYYYIMLRKFKDALTNEELRAYLGIVFGAVLLICINIGGSYNSISKLFQDVFFTVSSIITTTGYSTADFGNWPLFSHVILLILMFFGACAGSTAGGLKISRIIILFKSSINEIRTVINPRRVITMTEQGKKVPIKAIDKVHTYFIIYMAVFVSALVIVSTEVSDFTTAFSAVTATLNNIGPGLAAVGPTGNFAFFSPFVKWVLTIVMIIGRLEIFPILVLFSTSTWRKG